MQTNNARKLKLSVAMAVVVAALFSVVPLMAVTYIPVLNGNVSMGQWYFDGENSSLGGNLLMNFTPAFRYSNRFALIPNVYTNYRGTRSAEELAGGNTLFQDTWENGVSLKAVHGVGPVWKLKENIGYRVKWFRETTDESFNNGLYDYHIANVGFEAERKLGNHFVALGYDFSFLKFPNYQSLESSQDDDMSREYAGENVLDTNVHFMSLRASSPFFAGIKNGYQLFYSPRLYKDQTVVVDSGLLTSEKREDDYVGANLSMERDFKTSTKSSLRAMIFYALGKMDSNQNHYDAELTEFIPNFYSYTQTQVGTQLSFSLTRTPAGPTVFDIGYSISHRHYEDRVTQTVNGAYNTDKLYVNETNLILGYSHPLARCLRLTVDATFGHSSSNNDYEAAYRYNYSNSNYMFGFQYEY